MFAKLNLELNLLATIGSVQHQGGALEVVLEVAHPQTKEVNVEMTDGLEAEIETEGERGLVAGIKEDLGQETGSALGKTLVSSRLMINWAFSAKSGLFKSITWTGI